MSDPERFLYVMRYGEYAKVGVAMDLGQRLSWYRWRARKDDVTFTPLIVLPPHLNAGENEHATVRHFIPKGQKWTEWLSVDPGAVVAFARQFPRIEVQRPHYVQNIQMRGVDRLAARYGFELVS